MSKLISVGKILNFHGIKGDVKVGFTAGKENLIKSLKKVIVYINDEKKVYDVTAVKFHKNFALMKFKQINSINEVMEIKGLLIHTTEDILKQNLTTDEYLIKDLLNLDVFDEEGNSIGRISDLGENKANDLLEIQKPNGTKFIIPFVKEWVPVVDINNKKIIIKNPQGLENSEQETK